MSDEMIGLARVRTPHKYPSLILAPSYQQGTYDRYAVDCPFVFRHEGRFYMTHVGWDGIGYRTGLAVSDDLVYWTKEGVILDRGPVGSVTAFNAALTWIVRDNDLFGQGMLKSVEGRFLGTYHAYPRPGYEAGPAAIGLCWSADLHHWEIEAPILIASEGADWERGGLYKSCLLEVDGTWYLFYNAKNREHWPWIEQIGVAMSTDLTHWTRHVGNPILPVGTVGAFDEIFASDPCVLRCGEVWAMFYYGLASDGHARDGVAFAHDLFHWVKAPEILIDVGPPGAIDARHAHKPALFYDRGRLYHFYCAVAPVARFQEAVGQDEIRGIGLATS